MGADSRFDDRVCFSFDLDWAPDFMLADFRELLLEAGVPATIFFTHSSPECERLCQLPGCEVGVHPNFFKPSGHEEVLDELLTAYPGARGVRNHVLYYHSRLLPLFHRRRIAYFSNELRFLEADLAPHYDWSGLLRLPLFWEDDVHLMFFDRRFELAELELQRPGMKVFNFHPVHLYLNSPDMLYYAAHKEAIRDPRHGPTLRLRDAPGVRTLFRELVAWAREHAVLSTLGAVADEHRSQVPYRGRYADYLAAADAQERRPAAANAEVEDDGTRA